MKDRIKDFLKELLRPKPIKWKQIIGITALMFLWLFMGFFMGYYAGTGLLPTFTNTESVVIPEISVATLADVQTTLEQAPDKEYGVGYNCVDFAWDATRQLAWNGQPAVIIAVIFEEPPFHALLLTPTTDEGWIYIEPQSGIVVKPKVGGFYGSREVIAINVLKMVWVSVDEFIEAPEFQEFKERN